MPRMTTPKAMTRVVHVLFPQPCAAAMNYAVHTLVPFILVPFIEEDRRLLVEQLVRVESQERPRVRVGVEAD